MTTTGRKRNAGRQTELSETVSERVEESKQSQMGRFVADKHEALCSLSQSHIAERKRGQITAVSLQHAVTMEY